MERRERSAKVRTTERIAKLVGFDYDFYKFKYGGYFSGYQMEQVAIKLEKLQEELDIERAKHSQG